MPHPEMTPRKIDRGWQPHKEQDSQRAVSQKRWSQSKPRDEADPKKGRTESEGKPGKVQVSFDWSMTGIQKPAPKPDSQPPSSKQNVTGASMRSAVAKESQKHATRTDLSRNPNAQLGNPEKREIKEKSHRWIESRMKHLDPAGYMEEINSLRYFGRNAGCFALQIIAIADWGRKYMDMGFRYPIPTFPQFLFTPVTDSHQSGSQVPVKLSQLHNPRGHVHHRSREAWKWMVAVLQFWGDEASTADSIVYGGCECPVSALAEYIMNTINLGLEPGSKITWEDVVTQTPWMAKRLKGMMAAQEMTVRCQALPVPDESSELEVVLEKKYFEQLLRPKGRGKLLAENPTSPSHKPLPPSPGLTKVSRGETLKLHLKRATQGDVWSIEDPGQREGHPSQSLQETSTQQEGGQTVQPGRSPLTSELLALGEELTEVLDYEDVEENDPGIPDLEIAQAVAHIPPADAFADVEMMESQPPLGFEPEVSRSRYDVNLVCSSPTELGLTSPVTVMENEMLDGATSRTPGAGQPGAKEDPSHAEEN